MMDQFLANNEGRAFRMAEIATGNRDEALDIVQEAMFSLVKNYSHKAQAEWAPLFHRILQSKINDWHRRKTLMRKLGGWFTSANSSRDEEDEDPVQRIVDEQYKNPFEQLQQGKTTEAVIEALKSLPLRQQQAFMLRAWEGLSVAETAAAMSCAEGSVKTHYSRAVTALRLQLEAIL